MNGIPGCKNRSLFLLVSLFFHRTASRLFAIFLVALGFLSFQNEVLAAVAHDAASESHAGTTGSTNQASFTWTHTPAGTPRGVLVFVFTRSATQTVTGVTYGGVAMAAVAGGMAIDTAGEPGRVDTFFLGASIPTGARPVVVTRTNNATIMYATAATQTAGRDTEVTGIVLLEQNGTYTEQSVDDGSPGTNSLRYAFGYSGGSNVLAAGPNSTVLHSIDFGSYTGTMARETTAGQGARNIGFVYGSSDDRAGVHLAVREIPLVTTLATGTDPAAATIAPGAAATDVDLFTLQTSSGIEAITSVTVNLSTSSGVGRLAITNNAGTELGFTTSPVTGSNTITVAGMSATTALTTFRVRVTPLSHAAMPLPAGAAYVITAPVTAWAGPYTHVGSDTNPDALTIDNLSPNGATAVSGSAGSLQVSLDWTTSASADFSRSVVLRWTGAVAGAQVPAEGTDYVNGITIGIATVACVRTADAASTAVSGTDGAGTGGCSATPLAASQSYTYKVFQKDSNGNYDAGVALGTFTTYPPLTCVSDSFTGADNSAPNSANWNANKVSGSFTPVIFGNRLRITDISGSAATRATNKNLFPFGNNLVVAEFDYWAYGGSGADGIAITFSDPNTPTPGANNPPTTGGFGGSLGYANRNGAGCDVPGFSGGWIGVGIDEYGNYSNPTECRNGGPGARVNAVSIRGSGSGATSPSTSNYVYLTGTAALGANGVSSGASGTAYRYRITLDSITDLAKVIVKVEQDKTGAGYLPLFSYDLKPAITAGTQAPLPSQLQFTFTGSTGGSTNYHEVDNLSICAASVIPPSVLHHLEIQHGSGSGLTCAANTLTIRACADAACTSLYTGGVSGTLTATGAGMTVNWDGTTGGAAGAGFVIPSLSSSVTKDVQVATAGSVVFGITAPSPAPTNSTTCNFGSPTCTFTASLAGFIFSDTATPGNAYTIPAQVSGSATPTLYLRAVQASTSNPAVCTPAIVSQTTAVNMGYTCNNPASCQTGNLVTIKNTVTTTETAIASGGTSVSLNFDANGSAPITARYDDVGQITLNASKTVTPFSGATAIALNGSSNAYVVKPHHFDLSSIQQTAAPNLSNPAAADATGSKFVKAGELFSVTVTAKNALGGTTKNYGKETTAESVKLTSTLVAPATGNNPTIGGTFGAFSGGVATGTSFSWNEVGIITLTPGVGDADYLGAGDTTGTTGGNVGRFIPDYFDLAVTEACSGFTYSRQPFTITATAKNSGGGTTSNYDYSLASPSFAKYVDLSLPPGSPAESIGKIYVGATAASGGPPAVATGAIPATVFSSGVGTVLFSATTNPSPISFQFNATATPPTPIVLRATDSDSVTSSGHAEGSAMLYGGRARLINANGSEILDLPVPFRVEYWKDNLSGWIVNGSDICSGNINTVSLSLSSPPVSCVHDTGTPGDSGAGCAAAGPAMKQYKNAGVNSGNFNLWLKAPGFGNTGSVTITSTVPVWLQYPWLSGTPTSPVARATFGVIKSGPVIFRREMY